MFMQISVSSVKKYLSVQRLLLPYPKILFKGKKSVKVMMANFVTYTKIKYFFCKKKS